MTTRIVELPFADPRLGRHINHDDASKAFPMEMASEYRNATHLRRTPILNQGSLGSCTGNAGTGLLGTEPFYSALKVKFGVSMLTLNESYAVNLYSEATKIDPYPNEYPPTDTGSDGLSIMKVLRKAGVVHAYRHAFGLDHALRGLIRRPVIIGIPWYNSMFEPGPNGLLKVDPESGLAGGHEVELNIVDFTSTDPHNPVGRVRGPNSWDTSWGDGGYFEMDIADFGKLLEDYGDVMTATIAA
jgi:hypothetical protein